MLISNITKKIFGSRNERLIKKLHKIVASINSFEEKLSQLSDDELSHKTNEFRDRLATASLDDILPEAFAVVREAAYRTLNMRHFDVQLIGGLVLHSGKISEMRTGEGKTLVATLPAYLNALTGNGVHIITVNDYLAKRDAEWMQPIYNFLGLSVGVIIHGMDKQDKQQAYAADITYGTNNEFGFDYLRDNMAFAVSDRMQRKLSFAIVDEVDSILIDEARTPLIISGADEGSSELYHKINLIIPKLSKQQEKDGPGDYYVDEKSKQAYLTEEGHGKVEQLLIDAKLIAAGESLYNASNIALMHHVYAGLRAHALYKLDVDYIVKDNQVVIVDEHTGRTMPGRRWSDGLHQAVEAKERVKIENENQTLASITFQNYFRLYDKLAGMTGTADTEAYEFQQIYGLEVVVIPTNLPSKRQDLPDLIYLTQEEKFEAIIADIDDCVQRKQPVLVGTISIETSEFLSKLLQQRKIKHQVLNAKFHEKEAQIIAEAGRPGMVTIATNMAGRGTDIVLGGNLSAELEEGDITDKKQQWQKRHDEVIAAGGLHIIGTERHESRRIDNQLRGRAGRQGDPGSTRFYLSVKDNLMRIFISDNVSVMLNKLGMDKGEAITHPWVSKAVENAQRKVEGHNFDIRKQLLEFDDVANDQRKVIYQQRDELMKVDDISATISNIRDDVIHNLIIQYIPENTLEEEWQVNELNNCLREEFNLSLNLEEFIKQNPTFDVVQLHTYITDAFNSTYNNKQQLLGDERLRHLEKVIMLSVVDSHWKEHLALMDYMRQSIHLRGYAQKDPKQEYKREAFNLFTNMLESIKRETISILYSVQVTSDTDINTVDQSLRYEPQSIEYHHETAEIESKEEQPAKTFVREHPKVGRNDPCHCGSGKKFKQCHGKLL